MDTAHTVVKIVERSSPVCVVCNKKLNDPSTKLQCGCIMAVHERCAPIKCPQCVQKSSNRRDRIIGVIALLLCALVCVAVILIVLKFGYKII